MSESKTKLEIFADFVNKIPSPRDEGATDKLIVILKILKLLRDIKQPMLMTDIKSSLGLEKTYTSDLTQCHKGGILLYNEKEKPFLYKFNQEYSDALDYVYAYFEKASEFPIELIKKQIDGCVKWLLYNRDPKTKLWKINSNIGFISSANALVGLLEPCYMYDLSIIDDSINENLSEITESLESLINSRREDNGYIAGEDIRWPGQVSNISIVDSTSEVGFAIYYGLKMFTSEKENGKENINGKEIDKWIDQFSSSLEKTIKWLVDQKNLDGGWGSFKGLKSRVITTSVTTNLFYTLIGDFQDENIRSVVNKYKLKEHYNYGIKWFEDTGVKNLNGGWGFTSGDKPNIASTSLALLTLMTKKDEKDKIIIDNINLISKENQSIDVGKEEYWELKPGYEASIPYQSTTLKTLTLLNYYKDNIYSDEYIKQIVFKQIEQISRNLKKNKSTYYSTDPKIFAPSPIFTYLDSRCLLMYYSLYIIEKLVKPIFKLETNPISLIDNYQNGQIRMPL